MKRNLLNKILGVFLSFSMIVVTLIPNLAMANDNCDKDFYLKYKTVVQVEHEGEIYNVELTSNLPFDESSNNSIQPFAWSPEYPVGTVRYVDFDITREQLAWVSAGAEISIRVINDIAAKALMKAIPGIGYLSIALWLGVGAMIVVGVNGLHVSVKLVYDSHYHNKDGYYSYEWFIRDVNITPN